MATFAVMGVGMLVFYIGLRKARMGLTAAGAMIAVGAFCLPPDWW